MEEELDVAEEAIVVAMVLEKSMVLLEMEVVPLMSTITLMTKNGIQFQTKKITSITKSPVLYAPNFLPKLSSIPSVL